MEQGPKGFNDFIAHVRTGHSQNYNDLSQVLTNFSKSRNHLKIIGVGRAAGSKFHYEDPKLWAPA
jgi:hypothetical protein